MYKKAYKMYLEIIRIVACFMVIFNHTEENGFLLYIFQDYHKSIYWIYHFIAVIIKANVPLFLMVSGALMFDKEDTIKKIYTKRVPKILIALILFSFVSYLELVWLGGCQFSYKDFWITVYSSEQINWSYWYLYGYLSFLITVPFLKAIARSLDTKGVKYLIILATCINAFPCFSWLLFEDKYVVYSKIWPSWIAEMFVLYPLLGYYFDKKEVEKNKIRQLLVVNTCLIIVTCLFNWYRCSIKGGGYEELREIYNSAFTHINAITIFICIKYLSRMITCGRLKNIIFSVGRCTFGIYLLHIIIMRLPLMNGFWIVREWLHLNYMFTAIIYTICVFFIGYLITIVMKNVPFLNKIL